MMFLSELVRNTTRFQKVNAANDERETEVLRRCIHPFAKDEIGCERFENRGHAVPHSIHVGDVCETQVSDEKVDDTQVPGDSSCPIGETTLSRNTLEPEITDYFCETEEHDVHILVF